MVNLEQRERAHDSLLDESFYLDLIVRIERDQLDDLLGSIHHRYERQEAEQERKDRARNVNGKRQKRRKRYRFSTWETAFC